MHWIYLIHEFHNLSWITEINELFHDILIYWDAPVYAVYIYIYIYIYIYTAYIFLCYIYIILKGKGKNIWQNHKYELN